jgi:2-C-methyl-D-erythritol 4-phosphate cytidylyltransferase
MNEKIIAIVPAAGSGKRFGSGTNKPFVELCGKPLLLWAVEGLQAIPAVAEIIPVLKESDMDYGVSLFERHRVEKVKRLAPGGRERQDSVFHGLNLVDDEKSVILVHDGVRPLIATVDVFSAVEQLEGCDGVAVGVPVKDTVKEVRDCEVLSTLDRRLLWSVQTPQIFRYETIFHAYRKAAEESFSATDDAALVEHYGGKIRVVLGSYANIKVTTPEDMAIAEAFLRRAGMAP